MALYLADRVRELREEILKLRSHGESWKYKKGLAADAGRDRIRLRLEEIKAELGRLVPPKQQ